MAAARAPFFFFFFLRRASARARTPAQWPLRAPAAAAAPLRPPPGGVPAMADTKKQVWGDLEDDSDFDDEYDVPETRIEGPDANGIKTVKVRSAAAGSKT